MIVVKLMGGLGNQMFQYAAGRELAVLHNTSLVLDQSFLLNQPATINFTKRAYELDIFGTIQSKVKSIPKAFWWTARQVSKVSPRLCYFAEESNFPRYDIASESFWLQGYFQSEKYYSSIARQIREDFKFTRALSAVGEQQKSQIENLGNSVAVHIRRGDYITNPAAAAYHGTCSMSYYLNAINFMRDKVSNPSFIFFSDDIAWVRENFQDLSNCFYVDSDSSKSNWEDLCLMQMCKHNIIANSSFSWWGAWLNSNSEKTVIAPQKWFLEESGTSEIIPRSWVRI